MVHLHLNLNLCGTRYPDEEDFNFTDLEAARAQAIEEARSLMADEVNQGRLCLDGSIKIGDDSGQVVLAVPFDEALVVTGLSRTT